MTITHSLATPETPPEAPRNSPPLQASARDQREIDCRALTLILNASWSIRKCSKQATLFYLCPSLSRSSTSRRRGPSCSRPCGPRPCGGSRAWSASRRSLKPKMSLKLTILWELKQCPHPLWSWWRTWWCCRSSCTLEACLCRLPARCTSYCPQTTPPSQVADTCSTLVLEDKSWVIKVSKVGNEYKLSLIIYT